MKAGRLGSREAGKLIMIIELPSRIASQLQAYIAQ
jgi:hypothetical protein